jgi:hypothetical protein
MIAVRSYHRAKRSDKGRSGYGVHQAIRRIMARYRQAQSAWCPGQALPNQGRSRAAMYQIKYPKDIKVSDAQLAAFNLSRHSVHGDWNYTIAPTRKNPRQ